MHKTLLATLIAAPLLGAAGLGDIGVWFPDSDLAYAGASSLKLLSMVMEQLRQRSWRVGNVDATLLCQQPKLAGYLQDMRRNLARVMGIMPEEVNVKATTEEGLGFTGKGDGIAAHAVCLILPV